MQLAYHTKSSTLEKADPMRFALQQALRINCFSMILRVTHSLKVLLRASMKDVVTLLDEKASARLATSLRQRKREEAQRRSGLV